MPEKSIAAMGLANSLLSSAGAQPALIYYKLPTQSENNKICFSH